MPQSLLRHIHASRIFHAIRLRPNMSQREIARMAGADKSTVSAIVKNFEASGLIERSLKASENRPGRPGERISISSRGGLLVGVHPRPDEVRYVVSGLDGEPIRTLSRPLPDDTARLGSETADGIAALVGSIGRTVHEIRAVGVSIPGLVSSDGILTQSPNFGWRNVPLREILRRSVRCPLYIDNNANAAAVAEFLFGRGVDVGDFAYVESGSGVGAGLFFDGGLYRGPGGFAGEFGHTKIVPQGRPCRCGGLGCVSAYASDYSIMQRLQQKGIKVDKRDQVLALAHGGDPATLGVLDEAGRHLGIGFSNLVNLLNVGLFILGGGLEVFAPYMMSGIEQSLRDLSLPSALEGCRIERSGIGSHTEPRGGIALALEGCTSLHETEAAPW
jgi:predicted NBD/HSP70 family sugar kinase